MRLDLEPLAGAAQCQALSLSGLSLGPPQLQSPPDWATTLHVSIILTLMPKIKPIPFFPHETKPSRVTAILSICNKFEDCIANLAAFNRMPAICYISLWHP